MVLGLRYLDDSLPKCPTNLAISLNPKKKHIIAAQDALHQEIKMLIQKKGSHLRQPATVSPFPCLPFSIRTCCTTTPTSSSPLLITSSPILLGPHRRGGIPAWWLLLWLEAWRVSKQSKLEPIVNKAGYNDSLWLPDPISQDNSGSIDCEIGITAKTTHSPSLNPFLVGQTVCLSSSIYTGSSRTEAAGEGCSSWKLSN